jgi:FMN-dependent oxidoreductase (nitrilotriacetate monooxygenase family)
MGPAFVSEPDRLHLNMSLWLPGQLRTSWRLAERDPLAYIDVEYMRELVRTAQEARIDAVLLGDSPSLGTVLQAPPNGLDPTMLLANLSAGTEGIGFVATSTSTYNDPYNLARRYLALDHLTGGRGAVNIVTSFAPDAAANFGYSEPPPKEERYRRAHEFLEVVTKLWDAWDEDAIIADRQTGRWGAPDKIRPIDHHGEFFDVRGPLSVPPSPQGRPVIVQAGGSEGGLALAGAFADAVFTVAQTKEKAVAFRQDIRRRAAAAGRDADSVKISLGLVVITDETEARARERERELYETIPIEAATEALAGQLGIATDKVSPDAPIDPADLPAGPTGTGPEGFQISTRSLIAAEPITPRQLIYRSAGGGGHRLVVGAPEQIADEIEDWFRSGTADGFTVMGADAAVDFENFARHVVPELQRRGLVDRDYAGSTLRENYGLPRPHPPTRTGNGRRPANRPRGRELHVNVNMLHAGVFGGAWRFPGTDPLGSYRLDHYVRIARKAQAALLDAVFLADGAAIRDDIRYRPTSNLEPTVVLTAVARATERIGLIGTLSSSFNDPYDIARRLATLDQLSRGRAGWNVVTTADVESARNFGLDDPIEHGLRYEIAAEFVEVVRALWNSWEPDALVGDRASGVFADRERIHAIDHHGAHFTVAGPLQVPRSPQGEPVIVQAGASTDGRALAARIGEVIFSAAQTLAAAQEYYSDIKARTVAWGRRPDQVVVLPGLCTVIGSTEAEARERREQLDELLHPNYALGRLAGQLGLAPDALELDEQLPFELLPEMDEAGGSQTFYRIVIETARRDRLTVRELLRHLGGGVGHRIVVGTPEQIADTMVEWVDAGAADGFNVMPDVLPEGFDDFADHVIPELQRRGRFRTEYTGTTLREHLGLPAPAYRAPGRPAPAQTQRPAAEAIGAAR